MGKGAWKKGNFQGSAQNWAQGYSNAGANLAAGVNNPTRDPTQAAIAAKDSMLAGINQAVQSGAWASGLQRAGLAGWQQGMKAYAQTGLATKAQKGQPRYAAFAQSYGPAITAQASSLPPRGPAGTNQARSAQINDWAHSQRGKYRHAWRGG